MGYLDAYIIPFSGLKGGKHEFRFIVDSLFFEQFEYSLMKEGTLTVDVILERSERMLDFTFVIKGIMVCPCDRCGDPAEIRVDGRERLLVKIGDGYPEENDSIITIPDTVSRFDISPHIYDYINLMIPSRRVHADTPDGLPGCNADVLKILEELSTGPTTDPRWEILKEIQRKSKI